MTGENTRVLVVDDEEIVRESLGGWLQEDGFQVSSAPVPPSPRARTRNVWAPAPSPTR